MAKISRSHREWRIWLWHPKPEPSIRNWSHPNIRKRLLYEATTFPEDTCLSPSGQSPGLPGPPADPASMRATFQPSSRHQTGESLSLFYRWIHTDRVKSGTLTIATWRVNTEPNLWFLAWPFIFVMCLKHLWRPLKILRKKRERPCPTFVHCLILSPWWRWGFHSSQHNLRTVSRRPTPRGIPEI